jgi:hypothetical protein
VNGRGHLAQVRRLLPVVAGGKVSIMVIANAFFVIFLLIMTLLEGGAASSAIEACVILPAMILVVLCSSDTVAQLRATGELELAVTLASPAQVLLHRLAPVLLIAVIQVLVVSAVLMTSYTPWKPLVGLLLTVLPLALAVVTSLYWNLRLRGAGAVVGASLATVIAAFFWLSNAEMFSEAENRFTHSVLDVVLSCLGGQLGLLLAAIWLATLARRRLQRAEELLDE